MTNIKICGLRHVEHALLAAEEGADMLGFVFAPSRRRIQPAQAAEIIAAVPTRARTRMVGVFVNETAEVMNRVADLCDLDLIQLSGDEEPDIITRLERPAIKTLHVRAGMDAAQLAEWVRGIPVEVVHLDAGEAGQYGGTGKTFDWSLVPAAERFILLSGGLTPLNVVQAIRAVRPWGVDVSSGVESDGQKDPAKISAFIRAARRADSAATLPPQRKAY